MDETGGPVVPGADPGWTTRAEPGLLLGRPWGDTSRRGRPFAKDPSVVSFRGRHLLYLSLPPAEAAARAPEAPAGPPVDAGWGVAIAESTDLVDWRIVGELPRLGDADANGRAAPGAVVIDGRVHLFVQTYGNGRADAICHAVSDDGVAFAPVGDQPVFAPRGAWSCGRAIDADAVVLEDRLVMGYATRDPDMRTQLVGFATAPLDSALGAGDWTDLSAEAPALAPTLPWERDCIEAPALCVRDGHLVCFYAGGYNNAPQQVGVATSADGGRTWMRLSDEPFVAVGRPGAWNSSDSGHPGLLVTPDGASHLFVQGNDDGGRTWRIAGMRLGWDGIRPRVQRRGTAGPTG